MLLKQLIQDLKSLLYEIAIIRWLLLLLVASTTTYICYVKGGRVYINNLEGWWSFLAYVIVYAFHYYGAIFILLPFKKVRELLKDVRFVLYSILGILVFATRSSSSIHVNLISNWFDEAEADVINYKFKYLIRSCYLLIPLTILWFINDRKQQPLYGFTGINKSLKPYLILLMCMVPLVAIASTQSDFIAYYPRIKLIMQPDVNMAEAIWFEFAYGLDFISIEFFFRGFLLLALINGEASKQLILPMALFYLSIHFGKPMGEAISSFFGGTILGLITYRSRSIYGGIMIHMGLAWLMEAGGVIGNMILNK